MKKKLLAMLLAAVMMMALFPTAFAAGAPTSGACGENLTWTYSDGVLTIDGAGSMDNYGYVYHVQQPWADYSEEIHTVVIGDGVTYMGTMAFLGLVNLTSVTIGSSVGNIGLEAFGGCENLTGVVIPNGVTVIDEWAFNGCSSLTSVTIPDSVTFIGAWAFDGCTSLTDIYYGGSEEQWQEVDNDGFNDPLLTATIHYNSTGPDTTEPVKPTFTDVPEGEWYADAVAWAAEQGYINGVGDNRFAPLNNCTHVQILTMLYRADRGGDAAASAEDMDEAVSWALEKGMIGASFDSDALCTRADAVKYIWAVLGEESDAVASFDDVSADADYADAVAWAVENGITDGTGNNQFTPDKVCNRGTIATFLYRAYVLEARLTAND